MKHIILYSGGLDSYITHHYAKIGMKGGDDVVPLYVPLGHRYQARELEAIAKTLPDTKLRWSLSTLGEYDESSDATIPNRNAYLVLSALKLISPGELGLIYLTVQKDEMSIPDRSAAFLQSMSDLILALEYAALVVSPWIDSDKTDMVSWYLLNGGKPEDLLKTWSCYTPRGISSGLHCGDCPACFRRAVAMGLNGIVELYEQDPFGTPTAMEYLRRAKLGEYSPDRNRRILDAMEGAHE